MAMNFPSMGVPQGPVPFSPIGGQPPPLPFAPSPSLGGFPTVPVAPPIPGGVAAPGTNPLVFGCGSELDKTV